MTTLVEGRKIAPGPLDAHLRAEFTYSVIETPRQATQSDKRRKERSRTRLRAGHLADRGNRVIVDCLIQDRSPSGARLRLALDKPLPKTFLLVDETSQARFTADLAWQHGCDAGVRLTEL